MVTKMEFVQVSPSELLNRLGLQQRGQVQKYFDNLVAINLMEYVSKKTGVQELSIKISSVPGSGKVHINVPYAKYQAYSKRIKKRVGKRGTRPFERMVSDRKDYMLNELAIECRRVDK